jgi:hypothetical protein
MVVSKIGRWPPGRIITIAFVLPLCFLVGSALAASHKVNGFTEWLDGTLALWYRLG